MNYKVSICASVDASTSMNACEVKATSTTGNPPTYNEGARPSMYLKSNVVIASNNTGDGTYEYPYSIELGD